MNEVAEWESKHTVSTEQKALIKKTIAPDATDAELELFCYDCLRRGVHPLDRLIHYTKRKGRYVPITGIDFLRMKADETGKYAGSEEPLYEMDSESKFPSKATVRISKLVDGQRCDFSATARWTEYYPGDGDVGFMWRKMPFLMLGKCAEALALRKAFPAQLHGLYTPEEMDQAEKDDTPVTVTFRFGPYKSKAPKDLSVEELCLVQAEYETLSADPTNPYRETNRRLLDAIKAEMQTRPLKPPVEHKGDAMLFEGYGQRMRTAQQTKGVPAGEKERIIREEQKLGATDKRLSVDQMTAINDLAVELLAGLSKQKT